MPQANLRQVRAVFAEIDDLPANDRRQALANCRCETAVRREVATLFDEASPATALTSFAGETLPPFQGPIRPVGSRLGELEIVRLLGRGSSGDVYLARQPSLDRLVALKVVRSDGGEARAMAQLDHRHIVQVYLTADDPARGVHLICMQYVPGTTLARVIAQLRNVPAAKLSGAAILDAVAECDAAADLDAVPPRPVDLSGFDQHAWRERERFAKLSYEQAVCSIVGQIADALHFAHRRGLLHRDVKPANVLIDPIGRAYLADFGLSAGPTQPGSAAKYPVGGTMAYMAPEHFEAFLTGDAAEISHHSDIYSLGVILHEMLTIAVPCRSLPEAAARSEFCFASLPTQNHPKPEPVGEPSAATPLELVVAQCLATSPRDRPADAAQLVRSLSGCGAHLESHSRLPRHDRTMRLVSRWPGLSAVLLVIAGFVPHVAGNLFNPAYNALVLFPRFDDEQRTALLAVAGLYGLVIFPLLTAVVARQVYRSGRTWYRIRMGRPAKSREVASARRLLLLQPNWAARLSLAGWLPLLVYVPAAMKFAGAGLSVGEYVHFAASIALCIAILTPYTWFVLQFAIVQFAYPYLWLDVERFDDQAAGELAPITAQARRFQVAACASPLLAAAYLLGVPPESISSNSLAMVRSLTMGLLAVAALGLLVGMRMSQLLRRSTDAICFASPNLRQ